MTTTVHAELKYVRNLGNFESAHVTFGITDSVRDGETVGEAANRVYRKVESLVEEKIKEIDEDAK